MGQASEWVCPIHLVVVVVIVVLLLLFFFLLGDRKRCKDLLPKLSSDRVRILRFAVFRLAVFCGLQFSVLPYFALLTSLSPVGNVLLGISGVFFKESQLLQSRATQRVHYFRVGARLEGHTALPMGLYYT